MFSKWVCDVCDSMCHWRLVVHHMIEMIHQSWTDSHSFSLCTKLQWHICLWRRDWSTPPCSPHRGSHRGCEVHSRWAPWTWLCQGCSHCASEDISIFLSGDRMHFQQQPLPCSFCGWKPLALVSGGHCPETASWASLSVDRLHLQRCSCQCLVPPMLLYCWESSFPLLASSYIMERINTAIHCFIKEYDS